MPDKPCAACRDEKNNYTKSIYLIYLFKCVIRKRIRPKKYAKACAFYVDSLLIKSFMKERKREKENIPLLLCYLNMAENFVVVMVEGKQGVFVRIIPNNQSSRWAKRELY